MLRSFLNHQVALVERIGARPEDGEDQRLHKRLVTATSLMTGMAGFVWGLLYMSFGEWLPGSIPLAYGVILYLSVLFFAFNSNVKLLRGILLTFLLLLPFLLMWSLGGFVLGSVVASWAMLVPLLALLLTTPRNAIYWFLAFLGLTILSAVIEPFLPTDNLLSPLARDIFFVIDVGIPSSVIFTLLHYFVTQRDAALGLLSHEKEKTERLLLNVLPKEIALLLKESDQSIADAFDDVSVLFADVVGFTPLSEMLTPRQAVDLLNEIFSHFDSLAEKHGVEKIRTIGDGYMAAAGVPHPHPIHAHALCQMALEMRAYMESRAVNGHLLDLEIRIGINSGAAVAGVIGTTKFHYDLWGDAVNISARMESHGVPGKIQIGQATYELIKDVFVCESRGWIEIKGKGPMQTWFLEDVIE